jgi:hypothetical protein
MNPDVPALLERDQFRPPAFRPIPVDPAWSGDADML